MADSRSYSIDDSILELYKGMENSLKTKTKKPIELILETALNKPDILREYLIAGAGIKQPFNSSEGFNNEDFALMLVDLATNKLQYNLIVQSKNLEIIVSKSSVYANLCEGFLIIKKSEKAKNEEIIIKVNDIKDVDLFDIINMKSESYKYFKKEDQPDYLYIRIIMDKTPIENEEDCDGE